VLPRPYFRDQNSRPPSAGATLLGGQGPRCAVFAPVGTSRGAPCAAMATVGPRPRVPSQVGSTLWIGNMEPWMDESYLAHTFSIAGNIANVKVCRDTKSGSTRCFAFLQMTSREDALNLLERLNGDQFIGMDGNRFRVSWATASIGEQRGGSAEQWASSLYVGNLDPAVNDISLFKVFSRRFESVAGAKVIFDITTGASKGYGFVRFMDAEEAEVALAQLQGHMCGARPMRLRKAMKSTNGPSSAPPAGAPAASAPGAAASQPPLPPPPAVPPSSVVIVGTYPGLSEQDLAMYFGIFGKVLRILFSWEQECTQVEFRDRAAAENCVQYLNEQAGITAYLMNTGDGHALGTLAAASASQIAAPAVTNTTMVEATSQMHAHVSEYLSKLPQPSVEHFGTLLQDPVFFRLFEEQLAKKRSADDDDEEVSRSSWLLQDGPELFSAGVDAAMMNADFLRSAGCLKSVCRAAPTMPIGERLLI